MVIVIGILNWICTAGFTNLNYSVAFIFGIGFWLISILVIHQIKLSIELNKPDVIHQTILVFFIVNAVVSLLIYLTIVYKTGAVNPYLYQGDYQKYFISTGDYIKGVSFDTSTTNAVLNAFGVVYFLSRKNVLMLMLCMIILLLTASNTTNLLLCGTLVFLFIFRSDRNQKSLITICFLLGIIFLAKVSPQNNNYVNKSLVAVFHINHETTATNNFLLPLSKEPDSVLTTEEQKKKIAILYLDSLYNLRKEKQKKNVSETASFVIPSPDINSSSFQHKSIVTAVEDDMLQFIHSHSTELPMSSDTDYHPKFPGKVIAWEQIINYFKQHPSKIVAGLGTGNFSSKLAFRTTGLDISGSYPRKLIYINDAFISNHLDLYLYFFTKKDGAHSIINNSDSVYEQLLSEYGLLGLFAFFIFYLGFFLKRMKQLTYGIPLLFLLTGIFFVGYWFEQLSIVVVFELLLFLNIKEEVKKR